MGHMKKTIKECAGTLWGNLLLAFTVAAFVLPYKVIMGGATGIGIVLSKILPMDTASIILIVNLLALLLGLFALGCDSLQAPLPVPCYIRFSSV